jgi:hypothetical protein
MTAAMRFSIKNYNAYNINVDEKQAIVVEVNGDENRISQFVDYARNYKPLKAQVSDIKVAPMEGYIMRIGEYAMFCTATQLNKAIPLLLDIRDAVIAVGQNVNAVGQDVKAVGLDVKEMSLELKSIRKDIGSLKEGQSEIISSLRDMHEDNNEKMAGVASNIQSIKTKLEMAN